MSKRTDTLFPYTTLFRSGDPSGWNQTDTSGRVFGSLIHGIWPERAVAIATAEKLPAAAYLLDERHVMVEGGKPTTVGLRGLDAVRTIEEAGADNQLSDEVVRAVYGLTDADRKGDVLGKGVVVSGDLGGRRIL